GLMRHRAPKPVAWLSMFLSRFASRLFAVHSECVDEAAFELHATLPQARQFLAAAEKLLTHRLQGLRLQHIGGGRGARPGSNTVGKFSWQNQYVLVSAAPCALLWPAAMIVWGPGFAASKHRHHCVQLVMALDGKLCVRSGPGGKWIWCGAALVRPDALHEIDATGFSLLIAFVDVESEFGAALLQTIDSEIAVVPEATVSFWRRCLGDPATLTSERVEPWIRNQL